MHLTAARAALLFPALLFLAGCPCAPDLSGSPATLDALVEQQVGELVRANKIVGAAVAVIDGEAERRFFVGETALGNGTLPDADTFYEMGSITKTFTGALLALMVAEGSVSLDTPIQELLPEGVNAPTFEGKGITLGDLASHISGLPRMANNAPPLPLSDPFSRYTHAQLYDFLSKYALTRAPQSAYEYSNLGIALLGHLLERKAGKPYAVLLQERILGPLGLEDTALALDADESARLAAPHRLGALHEWLCLSPTPSSSWSLGIFAPAGALRATLSDMVRYVRANMGARENALAPAADILYTPRAAASENILVAVAWHVLRRDGEADIVWHNGETGGYCAFAAFVPETRRAIVILANTDASVYTEAAALTILDGLDALD